MMSLGTLLVKHGWITKQQLGLAISKQREVGGRLGTCLMEMGVMAEDLLNRSLAEQQGVPSVAVEDLRGIPASVIRLLPAPIAIRYRAIPFRASHTDIDIAMLEVDNLWLQDELSFIVGRRLNPYIANEARIVEALAKYYKAPCSERFVQLLSRLNEKLEGVSGARASHPESRLIHSEVIESPSASAGTTAGSAQAAPRSPDAVSPKIQPPTPIPRRQSIPVSVEELASLETEPGGDPDIPATSELLQAQSQRQISLEESEVAMETSSEPHEIGQLLVTALSQLLTRVVLLQVDPARVRGWLAAGPGLDEQRLRRFEVTFDEPSIFFNLREGGSFFLGALPEMPPHQELMACWHKDLSDDCVVFPIRVRERLVALAYGDRGPMGLAELDLDRVRELCSIAGRAFERCIVEKKRRLRMPVERE